MRRRHFVCLACALGAAGAARAETPPAFGYSGPTGPLHWGNLNDHWRGCSAGANQSPVDLTGTLEAALPPIEFNYGESGREVLNTGHAIQVTAGPGSTLRVDGRSFRLLQFHFHAPSEHHVDGHDFPLEGHLVHESADGQLAVVAVLFETGPPNDLLEMLIAALPGGAGQRRLLGGGVTPAALLPASRDYYRYNGSLTTPPCTEGVRWLVMRKPLTAAPRQVAALADALGFANNRPTRPLNARTLLR